MAKKKKAALKPVARGFATTSQPKKVVPEAELEAVTALGDDTSKTEPQDATSSANGADGRSSGEVAEGLDWEEDSKLEEGIYQGYVERLQEKGDREVTKILKVGSGWCYAQILVAVYRYPALQAIEFDKRTNKGYIRLDVDPALRDEILDADREQRTEKGKFPSEGTVKNTDSSEINSGKNIDTG